MIMDSKNSIVIPGYSVFCLIDKEVIKMDLKNILLPSIILYFLLHISTAFGATIRVPEDYSTIQAAIDSASDDDTIEVSDGTYVENLDIDKKLTIQSVNGYLITTIQAADSNDHIFYISADYVTIEGFTICGALSSAGIYIEKGADHCTIINNRCGYDGDHKNRTGIFLKGTSYIDAYNTVTGNIISNNNNGVYIATSDSNVISNNVCNNNNENGIYITGSSENTLNSNICNSNGDNGVYMTLSDGNTIANNTCNSNYQNGIYFSTSCEGNQLSGNSCESNISVGIKLYHSGSNTLYMNICLTNDIGINLITYSSPLSEDNEIFYNTCQANTSYGIRFHSSNDNIIYLNDFSDNGIANVYSFNSTNVWHTPTTVAYQYKDSIYNGYLGNYYSDHTLLDSDGNGITDSSYILPGDESEDDVPLVEPYAEFIKPIITLIGESYIYAEACSYSDAGATASDIIDGDISSSIITDNPVDNQTPSTYYITYNVTNSLGFSADEITRTVELTPDIKYPAITLIGLESTFVFKGDTYNDRGATAWDSCDGDITANIITGGLPIDTDIAGTTQIVTYDVCDKAGNCGNAIRTIKVVERPTGDIYVGQGEIFGNIQSAIDASANGDTIIVEDGIYYENIDVYKQISIQSQNGYGTTTIMAISTDDHVFEITASYVTISGFTINIFESESPYYNTSGIYLESNTEYCNITNNYLNGSGNHKGISLSSSNNNIISDNICNASESSFLSYGIYLNDSSNNTISGNICNGVLNRGIQLRNESNNNVITDNTSSYNDRGIELYSSNNNQITGNAFDMNYWCAMILFYSNENIISDNSFSNTGGISGYGGIGIDIVSSNYNTFYLNDITDNENVNIGYSLSNNFWSSPDQLSYCYNGSPYENYLGNYYSDHIFIDSDDDGITDSSYDMSGSEPDDEYPLAVSAKYFSFLLPCDIDGDGVSNIQDAFPYDPEEWLDTDSDGIGNNADTDDDNDGMPDEWEAQYSLNALVNDASLDPDNDGYTNLLEYNEGGDPHDSATPFPWELFYPAFIKK